MKEINMREFLFVKDNNIMNRNTSIMW